MAVLGTPTETPTPNPDPWSASCDAYERAALRLEDSFDEANATKSRELGTQHGLARAIAFLAAQAYDHRCPSAPIDWTQTRRRFHRIADDLQARSEELRGLHDTTRDYGGSWIDVESCDQFYTRGALAVIETAASAPGARVDAAEADKPEASLLFAVDKALDKAWKPAQAVCAAEEKLRALMKPQ